MNIQDKRSDYEEYLLKMRRYFHQNPELSGKEYNSSRVIKEELDKMGIQWRACGLETGVLATVQGGKPGKTILLRGDMDALTVQEQTGLPYASQTEGVMHACGHDCHMAMLLTAAKILQDTREELCGTVRLAFQPAEEIAKGANSMIEQGAMDGVDACFAIHVWADVKSGSVSLASGPRMASCDEFRVAVKGKGCHGAQPEQGVDAVVATAAIINNLQTIVSRETSPMDPAVITIGTIQAGTRFNVVAENSYMTGTTRCFSKEIWDKFPDMLNRVIHSTAESLRAEAEVEYIRMVPPTINDDRVAAVGRAAAVKVMGEGAVADCPPTTGAEDFSCYTQKAPGAIALLGIYNEEKGTVWPNHSGNFLVDEEQLIKGALLYVQVARDFNSQE